MRVAVFGLGYVGAVTAACLADNGHQVWGVDVDPGKVGTIRSGRSPVAEPGLHELIEQVVSAGNLRATTDPAEALMGADASILCVGTPSTIEGGTDLTSIHSVISDLARGLEVVAPAAGCFHAVVIRSTVPPGTVEECGRGLDGRLLEQGIRTGVAMCPEFLREGTGIADFYHPPYTVIGSTDADTLRSVRELFCFIDAPVKEVEPRTAEALKYACNAYHATKVSFANEVGRIFRRLGVDTREVMNLFCEDTQLNISARYLRPGFSFGGSCLPKDLRSLLHLARMESVDLPQLSGTLTTNRLTTTDVVERVLRAPGRTVALIGLSFKSDSDDLRESPYVDLAETLLGKGYEVRIFDPIVNPATLIGANRTYVESRLPHLRALFKKTLSDALEDSDVVIISYASDDIEHALLGAPPRRIIDLDGRLGSEVEALSGYEGVSW
ncbi:MAG: nucleotide sugar dehydrogenase [Actinomycetota bacterium]|nr:nucleotide sugar dehydrogenase [Actinomycetota bacterium]